MEWYMGNLGERKYLVKKLEWGIHEDKCEKIDFGVVGNYLIEGSYETNKIVVCVHVGNYSCQFLNVIDGGRAPTSMANISLLFI